MNLLSTLLAFIVALGVLILVHEFGHYLVARWCGVKVLRFSLGFGRPLLVRRFGPDQTEWVLAAIPFGGFVAMLDERERPDKPIPEADLPRAFNRQTVGKRAAIVVAGPLANFLLAILLYTGLNTYGINEPRALLGAPPAGSLAAQSGLGLDGAAADSRVSLEARSLNGEVVQSMIDLRWRMLQLGASRENADLELVDGLGRVQRVKIDLSGVSGGELDGDFLRHIGLVTAQPRRVVGDLTAGGAAERAGLRKGDVVNRIDGKPVESAEQLVNLVKAAPGRMLRLDVDRDDLPLSVSITPDVVGSGSAASGRIGAAIRTVFPMTLVSYGLLDAFTRANRQTWDTSILTLRMIGKIFTGEVSIKTISGPVTIADYAGQSARIGLTMYLTFIAFISISIGLMNLLPIPMLDGGHLLYYLVEILIGRAPPERFVEWAQRAGFAVLAGLMLVALVNDFMRLLT